MSVLTKNRKLFADEYLIDLNGTRAYKVAYPKVKGDEVAAVNASRVLRDAKVQEYIDKRMKDREKRTEVTQDKVIQELAAIAFANASDYAKVVSKPIVINGVEVAGKTYSDVELTATDKLSVEQKKAISGIKQGKFGIEVSTCDKVHALELLGRHLGMFKDKVEVSGLQNEMSKLDDLIKQIGV